MHSTKTTTLTAAVLALPLLVGCGQGAEPSQAADAASSPPASQSTTASSEASTTPSVTTGHRTTSAAPAAESAAPTAAPPSAPAEHSPGTPSSSGAAAPSLPGVEDPCAGVCTVTGRFQMQHPVHGAMEIVSYQGVVPAGTIPQGMRPSVAVYRDGRAVNFERSPDGTKLSYFGPGPVTGDQTWDIAGKTPVDRYGNLYLTTGRGLTVFSPTTTGYSSNGTIPEANVFPSYPNDPAGLRINAAGEPTILVKDVAPGGAPTGKVLEYGWNGTTFVQKK